MDEKAGERLDKILAHHFPEHSRSRLSSWIKLDRITVNGEPARPSQRLSRGDVIVFAPPPSISSELAPQNIEVNIIFQDEHLAVVEKPAGLVVHPGAGHPDGTLVNALLHHLGGLSPIGAPERPGIVHRIDAGTSGLLVVARTEIAHNGLAKQFSAHSIQRIYRTLVWDHGLDDEGSLETLHHRHPKDRRKFTGKTQRGKRAVTHWRVVERLGPCAWLEVALETGRTHQIRVHLSEAGHPLVGDQTYGRRRRIEHIPALRQLGFDLGLKRQALHAAVLGFQHPVDGSQHLYESSLPADIAEIRDVLTRHFGG